MTPPTVELSRLNRTFPDFITTIDSHTEGEITRLIVDGPYSTSGSTMTEKLEYFKSSHDDIRSILTKEPRGQDLLAALLTDPVSPDAMFGLIYMDAKRYPYLCGHATIGAVATLEKTGFLNLSPGENRVGVDTPSGLMEVMVTVSADGSLESVALQMVPSFVYQTGQIVSVPDFGEIEVDLVCTGGFFAMVNTDKLGISLELQNRRILTDLGMKIIDAANEQLSITHPTRPDVTTVDVTEFYDTTKQDSAGTASGRGMVIYGESHVDRSPCGTGTASKLALLYHKGKIEMHAPYINHSPLGTAFKAALVAKEKVGPYDGLVTQIKGMAYLTGIHHFFVESHDPFPNGFIL